MDPRAAIQQALNPVIGPISMHLQQACGPCLEGDPAGAETQLRQAAALLADAGVLDPPDVALWLGWGRHLVAMWALPSHWETLIRLLRAYPWSAQTHSHLLHCQHFLPDTDPDALAEQHRRWARRHGPAVAPEPPRHAPGRPLRVGYLSPDFRVHCVGHFFAPILRHHDRTRVTVVGYANVAPAQRDEWTGRFREQFDLYRDVWGQPAAQVARQIQADGVDCLVDLAGHTAGHRLDVMALRPAPVQVTYLGYPNTTGLPSIDYRLTDAVLDGPESAGRVSETLVPLPGCFACYQGPDVPPPPEQPPAVEAGRVTFGSFVGAAKHNRELMALWAEVLRAVPHSRLLLRFQGAEDGVVQQQCRRTLERLGVEGERVAFDPMRPMVEHLAQYRRVDIALDSAPWSSHTSLCEALWMGVPVVTLAGPTAVSRLGSSVLRAAGLDGWVAQTPEGYVAIARDLAGDLDALRTWRRDLRDRFGGSLVCDGATHTRALEDAYESMVSA